MYFGGKARVGKHLVEYMQPYVDKSDGYLEPFLGAGWVMKDIKHDDRIGSDACLPLIVLWKHLQRGWEPPEYLSEQKYLELKKVQDPYDPLTAFAGFGCSFSGKWFGGYARSGNRNYASNAKNSLLRKIKTMKDVKFLSVDYKFFYPTNSVIYCDPPYKDTTQYGVVGKFDHKEFWDRCRKWSKTNLVFVSEYSAPEDIDLAISFNTKTDIRNKEGKKEPRKENLYYLGE